MKWNEIDLNVFSDIIESHNMYALELDNANKENEDSEINWGDLERSLDETIKAYVDYVLGEKNAKYFYKAFCSKAAAIEFVQDKAECFLNGINEDNLLDLIPELQLITYLSKKKGLKVRLQTH